MGWSVGDVWWLRHGEELVGEIIIESGDWPWLFGRFRPAPAFVAFKPLFDEEYALLGSDEDREAWDSVYARIDGSLTLVAPHGPVADFLLHIQDGKAWFRWSDEPLEMPS